MLRGVDGRSAAGQESETRFSWIPGWSRGRGGDAARWMLRKRCRRMGPAEGWDRRISHSPFSRSRSIGIVIKAYVSGWRPGQLISESFRLSENGITFGPHRGDYFWAFNAYSHIPCQPSSPIKTVWWCWWSWKMIEHRHYQETLRFFT